MVHLVLVHIILVHGYLKKNSIKWSKKCAWTINMWTRIMWTIEVREPSSLFFLNGSHFLAHIFAKFTLLPWSSEPWFTLYTSAKRFSIFSFNKNPLKVFFDLIEELIFSEIFERLFLNKKIQKMKIFKRLEKDRLGILVF